MTHSSENKKFLDKLSLVIPVNSLEIVLEAIGRAREETFKDAAEIMEINASSYEELLVSTPLSAWANGKYHAYKTAASTFRFKAALEEGGQQKEHNNEKNP